MSRIHEALKKAAQERSAQLAAGNGPSILEVADAPRTPLPLRGFEESTVGTAVVGDGPSFLRYEDLIKRCATPK